MNSHFRKKDMNDLLHRDVGKVLYKKWKDIEKFHNEGQSIHKGRRLGRAKLKPPVLPVDTYFN